MNRFTLVFVLAIAGSLAGCGGCGDDSGLGLLDTGPQTPSRVGGIVFYTFSIVEAKPGGPSINPLVLGAKDPAGLRMENIDVQLWKDNAMVDSTTTNQDGEYIFSNLVPLASYQVRVPYISSIEENRIAPLAMPPVGYFPFPPNANPDDELDSDGDFVPGAAGYSTAVITSPAAGVDDFSVDFGFQTTIINMLKAN